MADGASWAKADERGIPRPIWIEWFRRSRRDAARTREITRFNLICDWPEGLLTSVRMCVVVTELERTDTSFRRSKSSFVNWDVLECSNPVPVEDAGKYKGMLVSSSRRRNWRHRSEIHVSHLSYSHGANCAVPSVHYEDLELVRHLDPATGDD